jgi:putative transcriptional regulator
VVLLAAHGDDGAFGWIINGRDVMTLAELLDRADIAHGKLPETRNMRMGGPVSPQQVWLMYRSEERFADMEGQFEVGEGITATASRKILEAVAQGSAPKSLLGVVGYAGWAPGQLENEIRHGAWLPTDVTADVIFDVPTVELWTRAYERIGASPIAFTSRTVGSA